ncbi:MAG: glycosyltransferase family 4 protein [Actinomycetota bacterium]
MRVVVASPGAGRTTRGYEVFALQLTEYLRGAGVDTELLTGGHVDGATRIHTIERRSRAAAVLAAGGRVEPHSIEQYTFAVAATRMIRRLGPDVVIASESALFGIWRRLHRALGDPTPRFVLTNGGSRRPPFRSVDAVIHHAADLRELAAAAEPERLHTHLPCPIHVPPWDEVDAMREPRRRSARRAELGIPETAYVVACVGAIDRAVKGIDRVAEALSRLPASIEGHLLLIGREGPDDAGLVAAIRDRVGGRLTVIETDPDEVGPTLALADVHVSASLTEGFGRVFLEAQAVGVPNLVHDTERSRTVTGGHATFVDTADPCALATAIADHAARPASVSTRVAWEHARANGWTTLGPSYVQALHEVATSERPR